MAKGSNRKKPTMKETVQVINQIIREVSNIRTDIATLNNVFNLYIEMQNNSDKFNEFVNDKLNVEEDNDVRKNEEGSTVSVEGSPQD